jgi:dTDP-4-dehydrorhamnose reductase
MIEDNNIRVMVTGSAGLLGTALLPKFIPHFELIAVYHNERPVVRDEFLQIISADLADPEECRKILDKIAPDIILNSAAWVDVDGCEMDRKRAYRSNFEIVQNLVDMAPDEHPLLIQVSTDYVFNGSSHPGKINDPPDPLNYYGETKLLAEEYLRDNYRNYLIARTCALIGSPQQGKTNLINYFYDNLRAGKQVFAPADLYANPIWIENLAELLLEAAQKRYNGVVLLGGLDYMSRYDCALQFAEIFDFDPNLRLS